MENLERKHFVLTKTLDAFNYLRTAKNAPDSEIHSKLDAAYTECKGQNEEVLGTLLRRLFLHIGDINRFHNILKSKGIPFDLKGAGGQERANMRSIIRWWATRMAGTFYTFETLELIEEFTSVDTLIHDSVKSDRYKGTIYDVEFMGYADSELEFIAEYIAHRIRNGYSVELWAKGLPKVETGTYRTTKKIVKCRPGVESYRWTLPQGKAWVKLNGEVVTPNMTVMSSIGTRAIEVRNGDTLSYPRAKQDAVLKRQRRNMKLIEKLSKKLNLEVIERTDRKGNSYKDFAGYKAFRKNQRTMEQLFASKAINNYSKNDFVAMLNRDSKAPIKLTSGARFRLSSMIAYKDENGNLKAKEGQWNKFGEWYVEWENYQEILAKQIRQTVTDDDPVKKAELMRKFKVRATGMQSLDILVELFKGALTDGQINTTYQAFIENIDFIANAYFVIDGSGSMRRIIKNSRSFKNQLQESKYDRLTFFDIAATLLIAFATRNPNPDFRNTYGWFSNDFFPCGDSKFIDNRPNQFVAGRRFYEQAVGQVLSENWSYTENLNSLRKNNPGIIGSTNMFATVDFFVNLVANRGHNVEELPQALVFITDCEVNRGKTPKEAYEHAAAIGWYPLFVFWAIEENRMDRFAGLPNMLFIGGFNEGALSQVLMGIKSGSVDPVDELWAIHDDVRYSLMG